MGDETPVGKFEEARGPNVRVLRHAQRRHFPTEVEALIAEYEAGTRVCDLAQKFGLHRVTVAGHVARARGTRPVITEAQIDAAVELYGRWWTLGGIAEHLRVDDRTVRRAPVERGVTIRPGGRQPKLVAAAA